MKKKRHENVIASTLMHNVLSDKAIFEIEKMGDVAFEDIASRIQGGTLDEREMRNAFRLLIVLCRQFCARRKPELVRIAIPFLTDARLEVRSAATNAGTSEARMIQRLQSSPPSLEMEESVRLTFNEALRRALTMGLNPREDHLARDYLRGVPGSNP